MKIETKYNIGDEVWVTHYTGNIVKCLVVEIIISVNRSGVYMSYMIGGLGGRPAAFLEDKLFPTKEELLKSL